MRRFLVGVLLGALAVLGVPAVADHVTEPTAAITEMKVQIFRYPDFDTVVDCDQIEPVDWFAARVHVNVYHEANGSASTASPSEHWNVRMDVNKVTRFIDGDPRFPRFNRDWTASWGHQNDAPHKTKNATEFRADLYGLSEHTGVWMVDITVTGSVSGRVLKQVCMFKKLP